MTRTVAAVVLAAAVVVGLGLLTASALEGSVTYYRTPTELVTDPGTDSTVRLGGLVVAGTVERHGRTTSFTLTDGAHDVEVVSRDDPPRTFRGGQGAVVEGRLVPDGVFEAEQIIVRHSNEYRPREEAAS